MYARYLCKWRFGWARAAAVADAAKAVVAEAERITAEAAQAVAA